MEVSHPPDLQIFINDILDTILMWHLQERRDTGIVWGGGSEGKRQTHIGDTIF